MSRSSRTSSCTRSPRFGFEASVSARQLRRRSSAAKRCGSPTLHSPQDYENGLLGHTRFRSQAHARGKSPPVDSRRACQACPAEAVDEAPARNVPTRAVCISSQGDSRTHPISIPSGCGTFVPIRPRSALPINHADTRSPYGTRGHMRLSMFCSVLRQVDY